MGTQRKWGPNGWETISGGGGSASSPFSSEAAEAKARELELGPDEIKATGSGGKITVKDVESAAANQDGGNGDDD